MLHIFSPSPLALYMLPAAEISWWLVITELICTCLLIALIFLFKNRFWKILSACAAEVCLFLVCNQVFGGEAILTRIMCWVTAAVACIATVGIVSLIDWSGRRGQPKK